MCNEDIELIRYEGGRDEFGKFKKKKTISNEIFGEIQDVRRNEYYSGLAQGLQLSLEVKIWKVDYSGEALLKYNGNYYDIIRTLSDPNNREKMILICEKREYDEQG